MINLKNIPSEIRKEFENDLQRVIRWDNKKRGRGSSRYAEESKLLGKLALSNNDFAVSEKQVDYTPSNGNSWKTYEYLAWNSSHTLAKQICRPVVYFKDGNSYGAAIMLPGNDDVKAPIVFFTPDFVKDYCLVNDKVCQGLDSLLSFMKNNIVINWQGESKDIKLKFANGNGIAMLIDEEHQIYAAKSFCEGKTIKGVQFKKMVMRMVNMERGSLVLSVQLQDQLAGHTSDSLKSAIVSRYINHGYSKSVAEKMRTLLFHIVNTTDILSIERNKVVLIGDDSDEVKQLERETLYKFVTENPKVAQWKQPDVLTVVVKYIQGIREDMEVRNIILAFCLALSEYKKKVGNLSSARMNYSSCIKYPKKYSEIWEEVDKRAVDARLFDDTDVSSIPVHEKTNSK